MEVNYSKNDNNELFRCFEKKEVLDMENLQNYVPIYERFFSLNDNNYNLINLNQHYKLERYENDRAFIRSKDNILVDKKIFFKLSPLLDPVKYMTGKYDIDCDKLFNLPKLNKKDCHAKILDINNSAYVDSFATYLTSQLLHKHNFIHGLDFFGSYLGIKNNFEVDIIDDIEYLYESDFFTSNVNKLFKLDNSIHEEFINSGSRNHKKHLHISENLSPKYLNLSDIKDLNCLDDIFKKDNNSIESKEGIEVLYSKDKNSSQILNKSITKSSSTCSSRTSLTESSSRSESSECESDYEGSSCSTATEDKIFASIHQFPVQIISLEKCDNTFDYLLSHNKITDLELGSAITQILMILITLQKVFNLTHNDLHTNNIMYIETSEKFLYYKLNEKHYKVPTYGRIFKVIDFGRAIYKYKKQEICSDSFHSKGDAATQYNFPPYFNEKKPRLEANNSFDLCRLGCSMYDFIVEEINDDVSKYTEIEQIILSWCYDDNNRNILYKKNGEERYPEFKLYKMIARSVHNHEPIKVFERYNYFQKYFVKSKIAKKQSQLMNIDDLPVYI